NPPTGCGGVWSSPAVDVERAMVFAGSANCVTSPAGWNDYSEAIFALDLKTGVPKWSYQPRGPSNNDFDFAGAPNLFETGGEARVGLGGKDGIYYALDRETGKLQWKYETTTPRVRKNFSSGGFIGASAIDDGIIVGGTAVGGTCPCLHGINASNGKQVWVQEEPAPTFAASAIVNGVAFSGSTTDFTLRAVDLKDGAVLWSHEMVGGVAGGTATDGRTLVAVAGIREPGVSPAGNQFGVYGFTLGSSNTTTSAAPSAVTLPPTSVAPPSTAPDPNAPEGPRCVGRPCDLDFTLAKPPSGTAPAISIHLRPAPFRIETRADDLGDPNDWLRPNSAAAKKGAVTYGVFASDDALKGSLLCVLDADFDCVNETLPDNVRPGYNRITVLAIDNTPVLPSATEGFNRIVSSISLDEPVTLR
ncbi:MAG TPA: PQQ-binding-like beta-propeller repeat protein, partial [Acidimicrobiia bacterium]|nr:PQQ-binding-like beta-propeller repeat protein [Acidimicrobiia bacterium]